MNDVRAAVAALAPTARRQLTDLVAIASIHDGGHAAQCRDAARRVAEEFAAVGIENLELVDTTDGSIAVLGHTPAPAGAPTVLLYSHYDVQPTGDPAVWESDPFTLTARPGPDGSPRWYGRGAADCKGNLVAHLTALAAARAVHGAFGVGVRVIIEGSEEAGGEGLDDLVTRRPEIADADVVLIADTGNVAVGTPTLTTALRGVAQVRVTVRTSTVALHSGMFGGAAPDALAALIALLATLRGPDGDTTIDGLPADGVWPGAQYDTAAFRADAGLRDDAPVLGSGTIADALWARPAVTVIGLDAPGTATAAAAIAPNAAALLNLRVPPGTDPAAAGAALAAHLTRRAPWGATVTADVESIGQPFAADTAGPWFGRLRAALSWAYDGAEVVTSGQGGSIPLCAALRAAAPHAEIALLGVEEPACRIHAANESVDPRELERIALAEAVLLSGRSIPAAPGDPA